ncbi:MAG: hypothetical protein A2X49_03270 [Lentisphaerae bacterium GWF2_52_8]|nr:MAG: hypothetical protein A2X49_03270 [Lentisphaerae bacterium GWF2_52_8]
MSGERFNTLLTALPPPGTRRLALHVLPKAERALQSGHPWLFSEGIVEQNCEGSAGDIAVVFDKRDRFLAAGLYDPDSIIRVRILANGQSEPIGPSLFMGRLSAAAAKRRGFEPRGTNGYRLVNGENDGLPGLVIDRYADTYVLKLYTAAWVLHLPGICSALDELCAPPNLVLRLNKATRALPEKLFGLSEGQALAGTNAQTVFSENNLLFEVDPVHGQKTGFFLDQRENRSKVGKLAGGKSVLNVFSYTGGFSLYAARGGASHVASLDISRPALDAAVRNFKLNCSDPNVAAARHELIAEDAFRALSSLAERKQFFDMLIVDPPSFAQKNADRHNALQAYARLTKFALRVLRPGGVLVSASCSSRVDANTFFDTVNSAAAACRRPLHEIERTAHAKDHPVTYREGAYLKCVFAVVP